MRVGRSSGNNHSRGVWDYRARRFIAESGNDTVCVGNAADSIPHVATFPVA